MNVALQFLIHQFGNIWHINLIDGLSWLSSCQLSLPSFLFYDPFSLEHQKPKLLQYRNPLVPFSRRSRGLDRNKPRVILSCPRGDVSRAGPSFRSRRIQGANTRGRCERGMGECSANGARVPDAAPLTRRPCELAGSHSAKIPLSPKEIRRLNRSRD